jgi:hypothetical protein
VRRSRVELAVLNNMRWYEAFFEAHGLPSGVDGRVWLSHQTAPPFHSNLVVLSPRTSLGEVEAHVRGLEATSRPAGWSMKDSYACLDLSSRGFAQLFQAEWIWRDPIEPATLDATSSLAWTQLATAMELMEWEDAWSGDTRNDSGTRIRRQFPERLLASPEHRFFAGRLDGKVIAGGIANRSPGVVGLSNVFSPAAFAQETWAALVVCIGAAFPNTPLVGYERGPELEFARAVGFAPIGTLRVWCRAA